MANPVSLSKILDPEEFPDAQIVMCIEGTLKKVFNPTKGTGNSGDYEYQDAIFADSSGKEIKLSFAKCSQPNSAAGKKVRIESVKTTQHGWQGIKIEDRTFRKNDEDQHERRLKITPSAKIEYAGGSSGGKNEQSSGGGQASGGGSRGPDLTLHPMEQIKQNIALHVEVRNQVKSAYSVGEGDATKLLVNESELQAAVASVYIESCKQGLAFQFIERASKPIPPKILPPPADPADWRKCQIPVGDLAGTTLEELGDDKMLELYDMANKKKKEGPFWACVRRATKDRGLLPQEEEKPKDPDLDVADDDIPF